MKPAPFTRTPCPTDEAVMQAISVLSNQAVSIYQELYAEGLTEPGGGGKFRVSRHINAGFLTVLLDVSLNAANSDCYTFTTKTPDGVLDKAHLVMEAYAAKRERCHALACCPLAVRRSCVCTASFDCPLHGHICHGSHN